MFRLKMIRKLRKIWFSFLNRNSEFKEFTPAQKKLFEEIQTGDIVDCWMPLQPDELLKMSEDHRHRPYYVLEKRESSILCFYGTSTQPDPKKQYVRVLVSKDMYNVWKDGYLCADGMTEIPVDCLIRKLDTLTEQTMQEVNRRITVLRHMGRYDGPLFPDGISSEKRACG
ncbi:MAG: type II toxin-antitoxin system PemK/MazF family toxin [Solobacterium sp.]|nr:type II toxin-antitoxin system PemK/MazF family toxin [Solobacterium sp.]